MKQRNKTIITIPMGVFAVLFISSAGRLLAHADQVNEKSVPVTATAPAAAWCFNVLF